MLAPQALVVAGFRFCFQGLRSFPGCRSGAGLFDEGGLSSEVRGAFTPRWFGPITNLAATHVAS